MEPNVIRAIIFLVAGLIMLFFPDKVATFQAFLVNKLGIKLTVDRDKRYYTVFGVVFVIIAIVLFIFGVN